MHLNTVPTLPRSIKRTVAAMVRLPLRVHRDQRGTISIVSVFAVLLLTMLLGMLMNVGRQVDGKIRMQNAADAAAYSGGLVLTRGMNDLAFTNHLLADVFALTAFMREARDQNAKSLVPGILTAWENVGAVFGGSRFQKFSALGPASPDICRRTHSSAASTHARAATLRLPVWAASSSNPASSVARSSAV